MKFSLLLASIPNAELWSKKRSETSLCNVRVEHNAIKCFLLFLPYFQAYHTRQNLFKVHLHRFTENSKCHFSRDVFLLWPFLCFYTRDYPRTDDNTNEFSSGGITHFFEGGTTNSCCFSKSGTTHSKIITKWNNEFMDVQ